MDHRSAQILDDFYGFFGKIARNGPKSKKNVKKFSTIRRLFFVFKGFRLARPGASLWGKCVKCHSFPHFFKIQRCVLTKKIRGFPMDSQALCNVGSQTNLFLFFSARHIP